MRKKILTMMVIVSALTLGACADENAIDEMLQEDIQLNQTGDPDDDDPPCNLGDPGCKG